MKIFVQSSVALYGSKMRRPHSLVCHCLLLSSLKLKIVPSSLLAKPIDTVNEVNL